MTHSHEPWDGVCDRDLEQRVRSCLFGRGYAALRLVTVHVTNGVVALGGKTPSFYMRQLAVECTKRVAGVRQMVDDLQVDSGVGRVGESLNLAPSNDSHDRPGRYDDLQQTSVLPHGATSSPRKKLLSSFHDRGAFHAQTNPVQPLTPGMPQVIRQRPLRLIRRKKGKSYVTSVVFRSRLRPLWLSLRLWKDNQCSRQFRACDREFWLIGSRLRQQRRESIRENVVWFK